MSQTERSDAFGMDIAHVARLARIELTQAESELFSRQLAVVVGHFQTLAEVDVSGVEPTAHAAPVVNVFREDEPRPGLDRETALANAPEHDMEQMLVPVIVQ